MSMKAVVAYLGAMLKPLGFSRKNANWNRQSGSFVQVINLQSSQFSETLTANLGVFDKGIYERFWRRSPAGVIREVDCIVRARIGELMGSGDRWWSSEAEGTATEIARELTEHALPFLDRFRSRGDLEQYLIETGVAMRRLPLPIIYLALLKADRGDRTAACEMLTALRSRPIGGWLDDVSRVSAELGCGR
jgi:hypothetical protein